jgi:hypothetical protein
MAKVVRCAESEALDTAYALSWCLMNEEAGQVDGQSDSSMDKILHSHVTRHVPQCTN